MKTWCILAAALGAGGCVLADTHTLEVEPKDAIVVAGPAAFSLDVRSPAREVEVALDGAVLGRYAPGRRGLTLPASVAAGVHDLAVRELGLPSASTLHRALGFYPSGVAIKSQSPSASEVAPDGPITLGVTFPVTILCPLVTPENAWLESGGARLAVKPRCSDDRLTILFDLQGGLAAQGTVEGVVSGRLFGQAGELRARWSGGIVQVSMGIASPLPNDPPTSTYVIGVSVELGSAAPAQLELRAGSILVATLGGLPQQKSWQVTWETAQVPDGDYPLTVQAPPPFRVAYSPPGAPTVTVDNVPPGLAQCPVLASYRSCLRPVLDGPGFLGDARLVLSGLTVAFFVDHDGNYCPKADDGPSFEPLTPPAYGPADLSGTARLEFDVYTKQFKKGLVTCDQALPRWAPLWGDPLHGIVAAGRIAHVEATDCVNGVCPPAARDAFLAIGAGADAGKVRLWTRSGGAWSSSATLNHDAAASASGLAGRYWIERVGGGAGVVRTDGPDPLNAVAGADATSLAGAMHEPWVLTQDVAAWSEQASQSGRVVVVAGTPLPRRDPGAVADEPAVMFAWALLDGLSAEKLVAYTERAPGGTARLRAARVSSGGVTFLDAIDSLDWTTDARTPTVFGAFGLAAVAWLEHDRVLTEVVTNASSGAVTPLGDATRKAREPRFDPNGRTPVLYWIEETPAGDAIRVARYRSDGWKYDPSPVNEPVSGAVPSFAVDANRVSWVDGAGAVHVRFANFPR